MHILTETSGIQTIYRLRNDYVDDVLGEAVISESANEIRLHGVFVKQEHRGKGYGEALMKAVLSRRENKPVTLCTGFGNIPFFKRFGFEISKVGESLVFMERNP